MNTKVPASLEFEARVGIISYYGHVIKPHHCHTAVLKSWLLLLVSFLPPISACAVACLHSQLYGVIRVSCLKTGHQTTSGHRRTGVLLPAGGRRSLALPTWKQYGGRKDIKNLVEVILKNDMQRHLWSNPSLRHNNRMPRLPSKGLYWGSAESLFIIIS